MTSAIGYLIFDTESIPDGTLLAKVKYAREELTPDAAIERAQTEARAASGNKSDFLPVTFQIPISASLLEVGDDFAPRRIRCLTGAPRELVAEFWAEVEREPRRLVTFNGAGFDLPLLELAAFRYGVAVPGHFSRRSTADDAGHLDLMDWLSNRGAIRFHGGLNLLSKLLGKPGKMDVHGDKVHALHRAGRHQEINDYCLFDTLDTYFVFLRTRVLTGELSLNEEQAMVHRVRSWLDTQSVEFPGLRVYLDNWGDWHPWV